MSHKSCFIIGLPAAGKTTFLAALWYCSQQPGKTILSLKHYSGNQHYLAQISETWLRAEKVSRTNIHTQEKSLTLTLVNNIQGELLEVAFPDLSGESFQKQYNDREIDSDDAEFIRKSDSILLFINPSKIKEPHLISDLSMECRKSQTESAIPSRNPSQDDPTEVQLVELLQFISFLREGAVVRLGVIVSAWDTVPTGENDHSEKFVREHLPLLWQYLSSNRAQFDVFFYGISAQGNPLETEEDIKTVSELEDKTERIIVVSGAENKSHDITLPLWTAVAQEGEELYDKN